MKLKSFAPVISKHSHILILGSMPSPRSLTEGEYYGHPQNHFWPLIASIFKKKTPFLSYDEKVNFLLSHHLALWDVCAHCRRQGAGDNRIRDMVPNRIPALLHKFPRIKKVVLNGRFAEKAWERYFGPSLSLPAFYVPSTSPAHAGLPLARKIREWRKVLIL